jgi:transcriptional regulator with XRE-family HTH domain
MGDRVKELRGLLDLSQQKVGELSGLGRIAIVKIEGGHNQLSSFEARAKLARGFGLSIEQLCAMLDGSLSPSEAMKLSHPVATENGTGTEG